MYVENFIFVYIKFQIYLLYTNRQTRIIVIRTSKSIFEWPKCI